MYQVLCGFTSFHSVQFEPFPLSTFHLLSMAHCFAAILITQMENKEYALLTPHTQFYHQWDMKRRITKNAVQTLIHCQYGALHCQVNSN